MPSQCDMCCGRRCQVGLRIWRSDCFEFCRPVLHVMQIRSPTMPCSYIISDGLAWWTGEYVSFVWGSNTCRIGVHFVQCWTVTVNLLLGGPSRQMAWRYGINLFINFGIKWRWMVSFAPRPLYPREAIFRHSYYNGRLNGPEGRPCTLCLSGESSYDSSTSHTVVYPRCRLYYPSCLLPVLWTLWSHNFVIISLEAIQSAGRIIENWTYGCCCSYCYYCY
jgi:hypothetical protein